MGFSGSLIRVEGKKTFNLLIHSFKIINEGFYQDNIILFGFSMGGSLSLRYGLGMIQLRGIIPVRLGERTEELINLLQ
ncbi:MAG: hypothetical protein CM1200mP10_07590 [Candidatus Neomarinimicrobiota bacterium]|nr:MAG: hypothetical protein CM1200mP10_07590 [Candidatus Neomarinimicrobiota bacterium]